MEYEMKELDMKALREEILRKCRKNIEPLTLHDEAEDDVYEEEDLQEEDLREEDLQEEDIFLKETDEIAEEELPFEDILAEKRRKYTAKEEFIYLLYNDILPAFVTEWDGYILRKKPFTKKASKDDTEIIQEYEGIDNYKKNNNSLIKEKEKKRDKTSTSSWKLSLPDEFVNITFYNKNSYHGRISRKMMEGEGIYRWHDGVQYKGQFEHNKIQGRGFLEWNNDCWYEGGFVDGLRHGKGLMVDRENKRMYVGQWHIDRKQEKG